MDIRAISLFCMLMFSSASFGQSRITLDSVDLSAPEKTEIMRDCLFGSEQGNCKDKEFGGSSEISLDDVVNLGVVDRTEVRSTDQNNSATSSPLPSIDLEIQFAYNSDELTPSAYMKLAELVKVMSDPRLRSQRLVFIGHTDAIGGQAYNLELSQRRAIAVASYVRALTGIAPARISSVGVGFSRLKNNFDPSAAENRRVQLVLVPMS